MIFRCLTSAIPKSPKASRSSHKLLVENIVALAEDDAGRRTLLQVAHPPHRPSSAPDGTCLLDFLVQGI
jgi:hypothetical protein